MPSVNARAPSAGARLRQAIGVERPLQMVGAIDAYSAILAEHSGFRALYLSGAGVANASLGLPDLGLLTLHDLLADARRITAATPLPLLVDADTGLGGPLMIERAVHELEAAGVAGLHIEDQEDDKRCGHRPDKRLVDTETMCARLRTAVGARRDPDFVVMARTDALAVEGLEPTLSRAVAYREAGADMLFAEAVVEPDDYRHITEAFGLPVLANLTEFGVTPLLGLDELREARVAIALYPLSAFRAMSAAALEVYQTLRRDGTQVELLGRMQTREALYAHLGYPAWERRQDEVRRDAGQT